MRLKRYFIIKIQLLFILGLLLLTNCGSVDNDQDEEVFEEVTDPKIETITIDPSKRNKQVSKNPGGVVSCWLLDSDIERPRETSFAVAMKDMGVKYIRFPYGHLADNYLWDADGDWGNTLTPKVATFSQTPSNWDWAVNQSSGEFRPGSIYSYYYPWRK